KTVSSMGVEWAKRTAPSSRSTGTTRLKLRSMRTAYRSGPEARIYGVLAPQHNRDVWLVAVEVHAVTIHDADLREVERWQRARVRAHRDGTQHRTGLPLTFVQRRDIHGLVDVHRQR